MKQSDVFTIILVAGVGILASFFACNALLGDPDMATTQFKELKGVISSNLQMPNPEVFNSTAINPTIEVYVGDDCEDIDQNGMLDTAELIACGRVEAPEATNPEDGEEDGGTTD